jgi:hypothetical protein
MLTRVRDRLTYANVVSSLSLFLVLGGGAYAAVTLPPNSVGTKQLKDKAVKRAKIANKAVTTPKLAPNAVKRAKIAANAVNGAKVANNTISGQDVNEVTLGQVPEAQHANKATDSDLLSDHTFGYFEAAARAEFGSANRTSTQRLKILEWTNAHAMVVTDGDGDANTQVRVRNTNAAGQGDLLVIDAAGNQIVITEGNDSDQIGTASNLNPDASNLHFVIARPDGRTIWVRCAFPAFVGAPVRCLGERSGPN